MLLLHGWRCKKGRLRVCSIYTVTRQLRNFCKNNGIRVDDVYSNWLIGYISGVSHPFLTHTYFAFAADRSQLKHIVCTPGVIETTQLHVDSTTGLLRMSELNFEQQVDNLCSVVIHNLCTATTP